MQVTNIHVVAGAVEVHIVVQSVAVTRRNPLVSELMCGRGERVREIDGVRRHARSEEKGIPIEFLDALQQLDVLRDEALRRLQRMRCRATVSVLVLLLVLLAAGSRSHLFFRNRVVERVDEFGDEFYEEVAEGTRGGRLELEFVNICLCEGLKMLGTNDSFKVVQKVETFLVGHRGKSVIGIFALQRPHHLSEALVLALEVAH